MFQHYFFARISATVFCINFKVLLIANNIQCESLKHKILDLKSYLSHENVLDVFEFTKIKLYSSIRKNNLLIRILTFRYRALIWTFFGPIYGYHSPPKIILFSPISEKYSSLKSKTVLETLKRPLLLVCKHLYNEYN